MRRIAVLCDFDGTVARQDVGNRLFETFSGNGESRRIVERWRRGEISSRECLEREAELVRADARAIERFLDAMTLDPYFRDFRDFARRRGIEVAIMSDGLDFYIEHLLVRHGVADVDFVANRLVFDGDRLRVEFPWYDMMDCRDCGCCKTHHLLRYREQGFFVVYVGDGLSDRCPCESADLVLAKGALREYCVERRIPHVPFRNFRDVERELIERLLLRGEIQPAPDDAS